MATTAFESVFVSLRARHPTGKRMPFKQKLVFASDDRASFVGAGAFPQVQLVAVTDIEFEDRDDPPAAFAAAVQDGLKQATAWLSKQSPAVFQELRAAGFATEVFFYLVTRPDPEGVDLNVSAEFVAECARHGLSVVIGTSIAEAEEDAD